MLNRSHTCVCACTHTRAFLSCLHLLFIHRLKADECLVRFEGHSEISSPQYLPCSFLKHLPLSGEPFKRYMVLGVVIQKKLIS